MSVINKCDLHGGKSMKHQSHRMNCSLHPIRETLIEYIRAGTEFLDVASYEPQGFMCCFHYRSSNEQKYP